MRLNLARFHLGLDHENDIKVTDDQTDLWWNRIKLNLIFPRRSISTSGWTKTSVSSEAGCFKSAATDTLIDLSISLIDYLFHFRLELENSLTQPAISQHQVRWLKTLQFVGSVDSRVLDVEAASRSVETGIRTIRRITMLSRHLH